MKYQYVFEINTALSRAFTRSIQLSVGEGDVTVEDIASDIDSALGTWRANVNCFRSDNSDRFTAGQPMPPEVKDLLFLLRQSYDFAKARAACDAEDSGEWSDRKFGLALAIGVVSSYYPAAENGPTTSTTKTTGEAGRPKGQLSDFLDGVTLEDFKAELSPQLEGKKGAGIGEVMRKQIKNGRLLSKKGFIAAFLREFGLDEKFVDGIRKYFKRRQPDILKYDDGAE